MLHFYVFFLDFIAVFILKIDKNSYDFLAFWRYSVAVARKNVSAVRFLVTTF